MGTYTNKILNQLNLSNKVQFNRIWSKRPLVTAMLTVSFYNCEILQLDLFSF